MVLSVNSYHEVMSNETDSTVLRDFDTFDTNGIRTTTEYMYLMPSVTDTGYSSGLDEE
jgi:hypothetical protein